MIPMMYRIKITIETCNDVVTETLYTGHLQAAVDLAEGFIAISGRIESEIQMWNVKRQNWIKFDKYWK